MQKLSQSLGAAASYGVAIAIFGFVGIAWVSVGCAYSLMAVASPAASAAIVGLFFLLLAALCALRLRAVMPGGGGAAPQSDHTQKPEESPETAIVSMLAGKAKDHPVYALGLAVAAGYASTQMAGKK